MLQVILNVYNLRLTKSTDMKYRLIIGGMIAYILLVLYSGIAVYIIIKVIECSKDLTCSRLELQPGLIYVLTTVGGLVSALVVSRMTLTSPGSDPAVFTYFREGQPIIVNIIVWCYLIIWTFTGLASLVVGVIIFPEICKTLSDIGTTWLGLAVASGYAYFNIDPK
jgi:hypothetical protein